MTTHSTAVFERQEKKYVLDKRQYTNLTAQLQSYMKPDAYGFNNISSLYFDTDDYKLIRHSLDKPAYKEKLRLRSYGIPKADDTVYLELKKKYQGITYKRRIQLTNREAEQYLKKNICPAQQGQIFQEIDWFVRQHPLQPKVLINYKRIALTGRENPELRITFDFDLCWRDHNLDLSKGGFGTPLLSPDYRLMEIKTLNAIPCWLSSMLTRLQIYPSSFSKYGYVYQNHLLYKEEVRHVG